MSILGVGSKELEEHRIDIIGGGCGRESVVIEAGRVGKAGSGRLIDEYQVSIAVPTPGIDRKVQVILDLMAKRPDREIRERERSKGQRVVG